MNIYEVDALTYATPAGRVLQQGLSFNLERGEMLLITGANGCGKSTLLRILLGQLPHEVGKIHCAVPDGKVEYIPQLENTEIHFPVTLRDVLTISQGKHVGDAEATQYGLLRADQLEGAWNTASGGERKRTLLTRALLRQPWMLVFDEPMNHLDDVSRRVMIRVMSEFLKEGGDEPRAIVMVCHQGLAPAERQLFDVLHLNLDAPAVHGVM